MFLFHFVKYKHRRWYMGKQEKGRKTSVCSQIDVFAICKLDREWKIRISVEKYFAEICTGNGFWLKTTIIAGYFVYMTTFLT